jgi:hypothetical protein
VYYIKMDLGEIIWGATGWIDVAQNSDKQRALVNLQTKSSVAFSPQANYAD